MATQSDAATHHGQETELEYGTLTNWQTTEMNLQHTKKGTFPGL